MEWMVGVEMEFIIIVWNENSLHEPVTRMDVHAIDLNSSVCLWPQM